MGYFGVKTEGWGSDKSLWDKELA